MSGRPVFEGAVQLTSRLVVESAVAVTTGLFITGGGSFRSVTLIVTADDTVTVPSVTATLTE